MTADAQAFDRTHAAALQRLWLLGDVHGEFKYIVRALQTTARPPRWLVFLGDVDIDRQPFHAWLGPIRRAAPEVQVAFIHGNHDADSAAHWAMLHDCGDALPLHGRVVTLDGVRVAGLGGHFQERVWAPPTAAIYANHQEAARQRRPMARNPQGPWLRPKLRAAIYPDTVRDLAAQRADLLVSHEAPSCHHHGWEAIDGLAHSLKVVRAFHGHHHDDRSNAYAAQRVRLGFDARAVGYCGIKDGLGTVIWAGEAGW